MEVYALVGKSGTGKSYQAMNLCREMGIASIVDDGVFIYGGSILAGVSAKRVKTKIGAIKTALFTDEEQRTAVRDKIIEVDPDSILIIGTSDGMVERIAERLELPKIGQTIYIEEITTSSEREAAEKQREMYGKHVIPVPAFQLKKDFSGYFIDPMRIIREFNAGRNAAGEKSVVRPTYSYMGNYNISYKVITDIARYAAKKTAGVCAMSRVATESGGDGIRITASVIMRSGTPCVAAAKELQKQISEDVESMTAFNVNDVTIEIKGIR